MALILSLAVSSFPNPMSCKLICHPKSVSMNSTTQFHRLKRYVGLLHYSRILFFFSVLIIIMYALKSIIVSLTQ